MTSTKSDIHFTEHQTIRRKEVTMVFLDFRYKSIWDKTYIEMIINSPKIIEHEERTKWLLNNNYKVLSNAINIDSKNNSIGYIKSGVKKVLAKIFFRKYLRSNGLPLDTQQNDEFITEHFLGKKVVKKDYLIDITIWNINKSLDMGFNYIALLIINSEIIGIVKCEVITEENYDEEYIPYRNMNLYISRVDIKRNYQGSGLCRPILSYMIKHLKRLGYEMLFIDNASTTNNGVPACVCYYKAGIENNYKIRWYSKHKKNKLQYLQKMNYIDCFKGKVNEAYYYISENVLNRALKKFKNYKNRID